MTKAASMAQVNVRMSPELKAAGEAAIASSGLTSTDVIRAVYELFSTGYEGISKLVHTLVDPRAGQEPLAEDDPGTLFLRGLNERYEAFYHSVGLNPNSVSSFTHYSYEELDALYWDERDRERGLGVYAE